MDSSDTEPVAQESIGLNADGQEIGPTADGQAIGPTAEETTPNDVKSDDNSVGEDESRSPEEKCNGEMHRNILFPWQDIS